VSVPQGNEHKPEAAELFFASLHAFHDRPISCEIVADQAAIAFQIWVPASLRSYVEAQLYAQYSDCRIEAQPDAIFLPVGQPTRMAYLTLASPGIMPIQTCHNLISDPLAAITAALSGLAAGEYLCIQIMAAGRPDGWQAGGYRYVDLVQAGQVAAHPGKNWLVSGVSAGLAGIGPAMVATALGREGTTSLANPTSAQRAEIAAIQSKVDQTGFRVAIRLIGSADDLGRIEQRLQAIAAAFQPFSVGDLNCFTLRRSTEGLSLAQQRAMPDRYSFTLTADELASIFHLPSAAVTAPGILWSRSKEAEPPAGLPREQADLFAQTRFRGQAVSFGIYPDDRLRHVYIVGKSGSGKSTAMKHLIIADMMTGRGCAVLDPHGDLYGDVLDLVPKQRVPDVVLLDPSDQDYPASLNVLEVKDPTHKTLVASALVDIFKRYFAYSWGPRLEYILRNCILTLLEVPNSTLLGIPRLLSDDGYRRWMVAQVQDPVLRDFWLREFAQMQTNPRLVTEAISPVQNKVGQFLSVPLVRHLVAQPKSTIDIDQILATGKILLVNLAKGKIGEDNAALLGAMLTARIQFAATSRVTLPMTERHLFTLYADEFQNFATSTFATLLSESRKYGLALVLAHQYTAQLPEDVRDAIFGNVGTIVAFAVGQADARVLAREFSPVYEDKDLIDQPGHDLVIKLMIRGAVSRPFSAVSLPPPHDVAGNRAQVIASSHAQYTRPVAVVQERIKTWSERVYRGFRQEAERQQPQKQEAKQQPPLLAPPATLAPAPSAA